MITLNMITMIEHQEDRARRLNHATSTPSRRAARHVLGAMMLAVGIFLAIRTFDPFQLTLAHAVSWTVAILGASAIALMPRD